MPIPKQLLSILLAASLVVQIANAETSGLLANPSFEEDVDNVGFPDGWTVGRNAEVTLTEDGVTSGRRALVIKSGYAAVSQNLELTKPSGRRMVLTLDARSPDNALLGVRVGYFIQDDAGKRWVDGPMIWDKKLDTEFQTLKAARVIPENALDGRFWFCIYRLKDEGTVIVDNISLEMRDDATSLGAKQTTILQREQNALLEKLRAASTRQPANPEWETLRKEMDALWETTSKSEKPDEAFALALVKIQELNARLLSALYPSRGFSAVLKPAYEQQSIDALPALKSESDGKLLGLSGESLALGLEVANTTQKPQIVTVRFEGDALSATDKVEVRRQVFMESWYSKGATLVADPLTLLPKEGDGWKLSLEPGEKVNLFVDMKLKAFAENANLEGTLKVKSSDQEESFPFALTVLADRPPTSPKLRHVQFLSSMQNVVNHQTEAAKNDLEAHGVTDIEWAFRPRAKFSASGELLDMSLGAHERWLAGFKDSNIQLNLFWAPSYKSFETSEGAKLTLLSPEWKRALKEQLTAYLDKAESMGISRDRFTILVRDEIHSKHLDTAPDEGITEYVEISKVIAEAEPNLRQYLTIGNYAFPADVEKVTPYLDMAIVHWPRPETMKRNAPAGYAAREEFYSKARPVLEDARKKGELELITYHVQSGKSANLLRTSRAYPLLAVAAGYTGFGYWAYNISQKSTWDDTDGSILDYTLIYDGQEDHPINKKYNVTGEGIVPSLRWMAIRDARQDAQILLYLKNLAQQEDCPSAIRTEVGKIQEMLRKIGGEHYYGGPELTLEAVNEVARQLREVYAKVPQK